MNCFLLTWVKNREPCKHNTDPGLHIEQESSCIISSLQRFFCDTLFLPRRINVDVLDHYAACVSLFQFFNYLSNFHKFWHDYCAIRGHSKDLLSKFIHLVITITTGWIVSEF